jgi:hypothetical protein
MPEVEVHIIADGGPTIKGVGEPGDLNKVQETSKF